MVYLNANRRVYDLYFNPMVDEFLIPTVSQPEHLVRFLILVQRIAVIPWIVYQYGRIIWAFDHDGGAFIQGFSALVTALLTALLATITYVYMRTSRKQLLLLAQPNIVVETKVDATMKQFAVNIYNKGAYPFRLRNVQVRAQDDDLQEFTVRLRELHCAVVGSGDYGHTRESIDNKNVSQENLDCGAFEDFLYVEFDCEDLMKLVARRYGYSKINGLKEVDVSKGK